MTVVAKGSNGGDYMPTPTGVQPALCVDVVDLGIQETPFKDEKTGRAKHAHKITVVWQLHPEDEDGNVILRTDGAPFRVMKYYTLSLNERANLRADLESWRGKPFTIEELKDGFDVEKLIGVQCQLNLMDRPSKKDPARTFTEVTAVMPKGRRDPAIEPDPDFVRQKDTPGGKDMRSPPESAKLPEPPEPEPEEEWEDEPDLPF
jgi:hypothetical protein